MVALLLLLIALVLFLLAAFREGLRSAHFGWLGLAVLTFLKIIAGAPYL